MSQTVMLRFGRAGWVLARLLLAALSVLALLSFGGQVVLAPFLVPLQWGVAAASERRGRILFSLLGGLLVGEIAWIVFGIIAADVVAFVFACGIAAGAGVLMYRTSAGRSRTPGR